MRLIKPSTEIINYTPNLQETIEAAGRTCYKSEDRATGPEATEKLIKHLKSLNHESVLEHGSVTVRFIVDRGVSHELVRHRLASFSQESTRYCNYSKEKFGEQATFILPPWMDELFVGEWDYDRLFEGVMEPDHRAFMQAMLAAEEYYFGLLELDWKPQQARAVLPNALKTEVVMTCNPREWRHVFKLRAVNEAAHPQIREVTLPLLEEFKAEWPLLFEDIC